MVTLSDSMAHTDRSMPPDCSLLWQAPMKLVKKLGLALATVMAMYEERKSYSMQKYLLLEMR